MKKIFLGIGVLIGYVIMAILLYITKKEAEENGKKCRKFTDYYQLFNKWISNTHKGLSNETFLESMNIKTIAVYGKGEVGSRLIESLQGASICVQCIIEKKIGSVVTDTTTGIQTVGLNDVNYYSDVDAIIVTPMFDFDKIKKEIISKGVTADVISIEDLIFWDML